MRVFVLTGLLATSQVWAQADSVPQSSFPASGYLSGWSVYADIDAWRAYDALPISEFESDWSVGYSPRNGRNTFLQRGRASAGVAKNGWRLGWEVRLDAVLTTDKQTLDTIQFYKQRNKPEPPASYSLQAHYMAVQAQGLRVGREFDGPRLAGRTTRIDVSGALYTQQRFREIDIEGTLSYPHADNYAFNVTHHEANNRKTFPFMQGNPSAYGGSLSLGLTAPLSDTVTLSVKADDIFSHMRWNRLPTTDQSLNSNVTSYDEDGYVNYRPLLSGRNSQVNRTIHLERYTAAALTYQQGSWQTTAQLARYARETIPSFTIAYRFPWLTVRTNVDTRFKTVGLGMELGNLRLQVQSDHTDLKKSKAQAIQLHYHLSF